MEVRSEGVRTGKRSRQRFHYEFQGQVIGENAWRFIHDLGKSRYVFILSFNKLRYLLQNSCLQNIAARLH